MKVLFYNWVDDRDPQRRGGGVRLYQANLRDALAEAGGVDVYSLSSGLAHDLRARRPRWRKLPGAGHEHRYEIVNAAVLSPAHAHFASPAQLDDEATVAVFADFVERNGPFDVIHFNSLEGLPADVLAHAARPPATRVFVTLHNYYPFCAQVNLWASEANACTDFRAGERCVDCLPVRANPRAVRLAYAVEGLFGRFGAGPGTLPFDRGFRPAMALGWRGVKKVAAAMRPRRPANVPGATNDAAEQTAGPEGGRWHAARRARFVELLNRHVSAVLCVSDRVRQIAAHHGVDSALLRTSYIGSPEAESWRHTRAKSHFVRPNAPVTLAFLGYMRRDKGFHFLLDALETLPQPLAARLRLKVAARGRDPGDLARLRALRHLLHGVEHHDGYTHDALDMLLADVDLGLIPVLWEDNLPQVAIEMHARHIPLICSDRGGARELGNCPSMVFPAGDAAGLHRVLDKVLAGRVLPADYWRNAMAPVSMTAHAGSLLDLYRSQTRG